MRSKSAGEEGVMLMSEAGAETDALRLRKSAGEEGVMLMSAAIIFGVYQAETGSYTLAGDRFTPLTAVPVTESVKDLACEDESPVRFYDTQAAADEAIAKLRAKFAARKTPPKTEN